VSNRMRRFPVAELVSIVIALLGLYTMVTTSPLPLSLSDLPVIIFLLFGPGYSVLRLFSESYGPLQMALFSVFVSLALLLGVVAVGHVTTGILILPIRIVLPVLAFIFLGLDYIRTRSRKERIGVLLTSG